MLHLGLQHRAIDGRVRLKSSVNVCFRVSAIKSDFYSFSLNHKRLQSGCFRILCWMSCRSCCPHASLRLLQLFQSRQRLHTADKIHQKQLQIELQIQLCGSQPCSSVFYVTSTSIRSAVELNLTFTSMYDTQHQVWSLDVIQTGTRYQTFSRKWQFASGRIPDCYHDRDFTEQTLSYQ